MGKKVNVYRNGYKTLELKFGHENNKTQKSANKYRLDPEVMRYPLLDKNPLNDNQYSIIAFARTGNDFFSSRMAFKGFTDVTDPQTGLDYWIPVIHISSDELDWLMEKLSPVMMAAAIGNRRLFVDAMKDLTRSVIPDITQKEMDEKDVKEIMALVSGLNVKLDYIGGRTLSQIKDENIVKQDEFNVMIANLQNKYRKLKKIRENRYDFSVVRNNTTWYWIPVEDLP